MENKHTADELRQFQALPLDIKIAMTKSRIRGWVNEFGTSGVYVSLSGGKDSTVLKHIVDSMYDNIPAVFVNTGLEYPEIQQFVRDIKAGKYDCFNSDVEILRPEMRFDEVIKKYGYPVASKVVARDVHFARKNFAEGKNTIRVRQLLGKEKNNQGQPSRYNKTKWLFLINAPFDTHSMCCEVMKKKPAKSYGKKTGRVPFIGSLAEESAERATNWVKFGCNAFEKKNPTSQPLSFWTEQDIYQYIKKYNVPICSVYGDIVPVPEDAEQLEGQMSIYETLEEYEGCKLQTTGCNRTGCIFCMFGCHLEKEPNRFQRLKETHPRQYDYCINGGETVDGKWQPSKEGLGLGKVLDYINVPYE